MGAANVLQNDHSPRRSQGAFDPVDHDVVMSNCGKQKGDHCCWLKGKPCPYLRKTRRRKRLEEGFYWQCQLRTELGSWEKVHQDQRYVRDVEPEWRLTGIKNCGDWPQGEKGNPECKLCGAKKADLE